MKQIKPRQNYLGVKGWVWAGNYKLERYLYLLHRITGLGMLLFVLFHMIETTFFRIQGQTMWEATMTLLENPWFEVGICLVAIAFVYHALNGLRLLLQEFGFALGKPTPPIYPYKDSLRRQRPWTIAMVSVVVIIALVFLIDIIV